MGLHLSARRAAVLGRPVAHSLSPVLHRAAYAALGLSDWRYDRIDCGAEDIAEVLAAADADADWAGFSVTMPAKRAALVAARTVSPLAATVGAANTLLPLPDGGWSADNTDVDGIAAALEPHLGTAGQLDDVTILGAGGTAAAAVVALAARAGSPLRVIVRDTARAGDVRDTGRRAGVEVDLLVASSPAAAVALRGCALLVSTLPIGAADRYAAIRWRADLVALDAIYQQWPTALAASVTAAGGVAVSGADLLLHQAVRQVALMTGRDAPVQAMRAALRGEVGTALS